MAEFEVQNCYSPCSLQSLYIVNGVIFLYPIPCLIQWLFKYNSNVRRVLRYLIFRTYCSLYLKCSSFSLFTSVAPMCPLDCLANILSSGKPSKTFLIRINPSSMCSDSPTLLPLLVISTHINYFNWCLSPPADQCEQGLSICLSFHL